MEKKILFVDDEPEWRSVVAEGLKAVGHEVIVAGDASEAMERTEGVSLGLIILDLNLAGEDGLMLMRFLRVNHPGVPVVIYTGRDDDEATITGMLTAGAVQYLRKGPMEELVRAVRRSFR
jgi:DNA-binding response OmpR family regulator